MGVEEAVAGKPPLAPPLLGEGNVLGVPHGHPHHPPLPVQDEAQGPPHLGGEGRQGVGELRGEDPVLGEAPPVQVGNPLQFALLEPLRAPENLIQSAPIIAGRPVRWGGWSSGFSSSPSFRPTPRRPTTGSWSWGRPSTGAGPPPPWSAASRPPSTSSGKAGGGGSPWPGARPRRTSIAKGRWAAATSRPGACPKRPFSARPEAGAPTRTSSSSNPTRGAPPPRYRRPPPSPGPLPGPALGLEAEGYPVPGNYPLGYWAKEALYRLWLYLGLRPQGVFSSRFNASR